MRWVAEPDHLDDVFQREVDEADWTCLEKVESFPDLKGELDEEPETFYARI